MQCRYGCTGDTPTNVTHQDLMIVLRHLLAQSLPPDEPGATGEYGASPIRETYFCFVDKALVYDMINCDRFIGLAKYPESVKPMQNEIGAIGNFRILLCHMPPTLKVGTIRASKDNEDIYTIKCCKTIGDKIPYGHENLWADLMCTKACKI